VRALRDDREPLALRAGEGVLQLAVAEYAAIRREIQTALSNQQSALSVGAATLGLLAAVGARFWPQNLVLAGLVFAITVPAACAMAVRMWYGELLRIARAAEFVARIEERVHAAAPGTMLGWEHRMYASREESEGDLDRANWRSVEVAFGALATMSIALGLYWLWIGPGWAMAVAIAGVDAFLCGHVIQHVIRLEQRAHALLARRSPDDRLTDRASPALGG
jgi:hypothetical protein